MRKPQQMVIKLGEQKMELLNLALAALHLDRQTYFDGAAKQLVLNAIYILRDYGYDTESPVDVEQLEKHFMEIWTTPVAKNAPFKLPADAEVA